MTKTLQQLLVPKLKDEVRTPKTPQPMETESKETRTNAISNVTVSFTTVDESILRPLQTAQSLMDLIRNKTNEACIERNGH